MYKHVITALTATATGLALMAGPVSAEDTAAALPCVDGNLALQASADSVLNVITADELLQGLFGAVDEDDVVDEEDVVDEDWTSSASLPDEDHVEAFAQGLLADVYDDPFLSAYQAWPAPDRAPLPVQARVVGVDNLLQGVLGTTTVVCVIGNGVVVSTAPDDTALISPYETSAVTPYETSAVTTSTGSQSLFDTLGINRIVEGIVSDFTP
jgi:hypothetical protein